MTSRRSIKFAAVAGAVGLGLTAYFIAPQVSAQNERAAPRAIAERGPLTTQESAIVSLYESARDSVVFISTGGNVEAPEPNSGRFFRDMPTGSGSGFFWDAKGHIITNHHVVAEAQRASVRLSDGRIFVAEVIGSYPRHDIAVLKIDIKENSPKALPVGSSADLKIGQATYAIGAPFSLDWTLTSGIVSGLNRDFPSRRGGLLSGLIQTDTAINPGNSGGPLLDSAGRLIGVNTAIYSPSGASAGISFAVPVDVVNRVVPQLINNGEYRSPIIGVNIDQRINSMLRRQGVKGVVVLGIVPNTPAAKLDIQPAMTADNGSITVRDVIISVESEPINTVSDLLAAVDSRTVGEKITLELEREGKRRKVELELGERPER